MTERTEPPVPGDRIFRRQRWLLRAAYALLRPLGLLPTRKVTWVVGTEEIALMVSHIARAIPGSFSVVHRTHPFYSVEYDLTIQKPSSRIEMYRRLYGGPLALAWLLHRAQGFIYVGAAGFLLSHLDDREFEFRFLRDHDKRIICYFTGSDIRSPRLMKQLEAEQKRPNVGTYLAQLDPIYTTTEYDEVRRRRARVADELADAVFSVRVDQRSYLTKPTEPFRYFYPDEEFRLLTEKYENPVPPIVLHAPSQPVLKGTEHVRAAVTRLRDEGYDFDYRELVGAPHEQVMAALTEAHIVLNQFYAFVPGVFGIEALAKCCALLTSADERIEPDLDPGANEAWLVTPATQIYSNLKKLLDDPSAAREQALRGFEWAREYASASRDAERFRAVLDRVASTGG